MPGTVLYKHCILNLIFFFFELNIGLIFSRCTIIKKLLFLYSFSSDLLQSSLINPMLHTILFLNANS